MPIVDERYIWNGIECEKCKRKESRCYGHYLGNIDEIARLQTEGRAQFASVPSSFMEQKFKTDMK